ncbi:MAG: hypothetical protein M3237_05150 [Actinomycetota bacterium]|nr:hypothetical protein [Actinomycetota bacterium]
MRQHAILKVLTSVVASTVLLLGFPTSAQAHYEETGKPCYAPTPSDPGSSCDAYVSLNWACCYYVRGFFDAYGERVKVKNVTPHRAKWHLYLPNQVDPSGYVGSRDCIEWGRSTRDGCRYIGGYNVPEGDRVYLEVCVYTSDHGWECAKPYAIA